MMGGVGYSLFDCPKNEEALLLVMFKHQWSYSVCEFACVKTD